MQKTKLGISTGALAALTCFACLFSGYLAAIILAGYVLLFEEDEWLKKTAVKAVSIMVFFSVAVTTVNLIPDAISFISNIAAVFNGAFAITVLTRIVTVITSGLNLAEKVLLLVLGVKALKQQTVDIPSIDSKLANFMDSVVSTDKVKEKVDDQTEESK